MSDHDENCDYRHGDEPCNNRLAEYEERIAALQTRVDALEGELQRACEDQCDACAEGLIAERATNELWLHPGKVGVCKADATRERRYQREKVG